uniref:vWA domain-containing protein n=1 Tax=Falsiroseomonas oryzae TaxID=2766473 RepID=UPI0022EB871E
MAHFAEISRAQPSCLLFLLDQSGSMGEDIAPGTTKAGFLADAVNRSLMDLVNRSTRAGAVVNDLDVGVFAYAGNSVGPAFGGALAGSHLCEIGALACSPARVEKRRKRVPDGAGGLVETTVDFPVWFEPQPGGGTPMCAALRMAGDMLADWCEEHPHAFPPTLLHVTDGEATDGTPAEVAAAAGHVMAQGTTEGRVVLMNLHLSGSLAEPVRFPDEEAARLDVHGRLLFAISSILPPQARRRATEEGLAVAEQSRALVYNARMPDVVAFFRVGTALRRASGAQWVKTTASSLRGAPTWLPPGLAAAALAEPAAPPPRPV